MTRISVFVRPDTDAGALCAKKVGYFDQELAPGAVCCIDCPEIGRRYFHPAGLWAHPTERTRLMHRATAFHEGKWTYLEAVAKVVDENGHVLAQEVLGGIPSDVPPEEIAEAEEFVRESIELQLFGRKAA